MARTRRGRQLRHAEADAHGVPVVVEESSSVPVRPGSVRGHSARRALRFEVRHQVGASRAPGPSPRTNGSQPALPPVRTKTIAPEVIVTSQPEMPSQPETSEPPRAPTLALEQRSPTAREASSTVDASSLDEGGDAAAGRSIRVRRRSLGRSARTEPDAGAGQTTVATISVSALPHVDEPESPADARPAEEPGADPQPEPKQAVAPMLTEVREALGEARSSNAIADATLRAIGDEVRAIGHRQLQYERKYVFNSVFAYVIFCVLIFTGLYFVFEMRSARNAADVDAYEGQIENLTHRLEIAESELEKYRQSSHLAFEIYQLIEQARHEEALERFVLVQDKLINPAESALLQASIESLKWKLADRAYRKGLDLFTTGNYEQARDAFFKSLSYQSETPYAHLLNYYLATSMYELGDFEGARRYFEAALQSELPTDLDAEAQYRHAVSTEEVGQAEKAYELYENFLKRRRYHKYSDDVVRRMGRIERSQIRERSAAQRAARDRVQQRQEADTGTVEPQE